MNENNKDLIAKLEQVNTLLCRNDDLRQYADEGVIFETSEKIEKIREARGDLPMVPSIFQTMPIFPIDKTASSVAEQKASSRKKIFLIVLAATLVSIFLFVVCGVTMFYSFAFVGIFASIITGFLSSSAKRDYDAKKKAYDTSVKTFNLTMNAFRDGLACYDKQKPEAIEQMKAFKERHQQAFINYCEALEEFGENRQNAEDEIQRNLEEIRQIDIIPEDYYYCVDRMIPILRAGRADSLKEALNMAIEIERQEREEYARRLAEEARQREEERRTAILAQQAAEERRHNEQMERQQAAHDRAMENQAREQARAAEKQAQQAAWNAKVQADKERQERQQAERRSRSAGISRCANCANSRHCPSHLKESGAGLTCGGYVPYGGR